MPIRLSKACQNLNVGMTTAIEYLASLDYFIQLDPNLKLSDELYLILAERFSKDMAQKIVAEKITLERQVKAQQIQRVSINDNTNNFELVNQLRHFKSSSQIDLNEENKNPTDIFLEQSEKIINSPLVSGTIDLDTLIQTSKLKTNNPNINDISLVKKNSIMKYKVGGKITGRINNIKVDGINGVSGVYVTLDAEDGFGFMPKALMPSYYDGNENLTKKKWDDIDVVVYKTDEKGLILCDNYTYEKQLNAQLEAQRKLNYQEQIRAFASNYKSGDIFEVEVVKIRNNEVKISLGGNIEGVIAKDEINWNEINQLNDLLFDGEIINAVYIGFENNKLQFSLKHLNEKPYDEKLYDLDLPALINYIGHSENSFIGQAKKYGNNTFIENLYSDSVTDKGKLLIDPIYSYNLRALVEENNNSEIQENLFYRISLKLVSRNRRIERNQLFQFIAIDIVKSDNPYKKDVELTFNKNTSPSMSVAAAHLLEEVGKNMYSTKDRMFFELVQNADDAASEKGVFMKVLTKSDYLLINHNGNSFDKDDFTAITSAANGTKKANENKTGYKGIGFKSVFTDSEVVFIKTGGYQFKFDKKDERFTDFDSFYFSVNQLESSEQKQNFLEKFDVERNRFKGVEDIPWQLEPIWVDEFPSELGWLFTKYNVSIALKLGENKILGENGYQKTIDDIICNPKFMLFLRNTKRIDFNKKSVSKDTKGNIITLKNSFDNDRVEMFERKDFQIEINDEVFDHRRIEIRVKIEKMDETSGNIIEAKFVDLHNHELESIPKKIAINKSTSISFAIPLSEHDKSINPNKAYTDISLFAFLPTLVKDFKFPFYINANFILDPPRQRVLGDNPWNFFLMQEIAIKIIDWSKELNERKEKNALNILVTEYFDESSTDTKQLATHFNFAYKSALEDVAFILNHSENLSKQDEIIFDKTGLAKISGSQTFCKIIGTDKKLPSETIDSSILKKKIFEKVEHVDFEDILNKLVDNAILSNWYVAVSEEKKIDFHNWLIKNDTVSKKIINSLPIFQFVNTIISRKEIDKYSNYIILTEHTNPICEILSKLGYECSNNLFEAHPLKDFIDIQVEKKLFDKIVNSQIVNNITSLDKLQLIIALADFNEIGESSIADISLFCNLNGDKTPLAKMLSFKEDTPDWLKPYMICAEENFPELAKYLINPKNEFSEVVWRNLNSIDLPIDELYSRYEWSDGKYTRELINKYKNTEVFKSTLLSIVEVADKAIKLYYLDNIQSLNLSPNEFYKKDSYEYRVLQLALNSLETPSSFSQKIYYNGDCITRFSVKDEVVCDYKIGSEQKKVKMSLAKLLPNYQNLSDLIEKIKSLFEVKKDLDSFFDAKTKTVYEVSSELNKLLSLPEANFSVWNVSGNAYQYLFSTYYRREKKGWNNLYVPNIDLKKETDEFIHELMNFLYENRVEILLSPFTYWVNRYFIDKYFSCDYIFGEEKLLPSIEKWADSEQKKSYLIQNGVRSFEDNSIRFRQLFIENQPIDFIDTLSDKDVFDSLYFFANSDDIKKPFEGNQQLEILKKIKKRIKAPINTSINMEVLTLNSQEWNSQEYNDWKKNDTKPGIFTFQSQMPKNMCLGDILMSTYNEDDYFYDKNNRNLFLNGQKNLDDLLFKIAKENETYFNLDDYQTLCRTGKITIQIEELEKKNKLIDELNQQNKKKDLLLQRYIEMYGQIEVNTDPINLHTHEISPTIKSGGNDAISQSTQYDAQIEAQRFLMQEKPNWIFPDYYGEINELGIPNHYSTFEVENEKDEIIPIVLKSYKMQNEPFKVNTIEWDFITKQGALLFIYTGYDIKRIKLQDLVRNQSSVAITFSTENLDIEERISAFADSLHFFKELHFDFESFKISNTAESIRDIYRINEGVQVSNTKEDI